MSDVVLTEEEFRAMSQAVQALAKFHKEDVIRVFMKLGCFHFLSKAQLIELSKRIERAR